MEEHSVIPRETTGKIIRRSIYIFLQNYQYLTTAAALLLLPFSASLLLSQALLPSFSFLPTVHSRLQFIFDAAGFPHSELFTGLVQKLSQTIVSSILLLPFTLSFLLIAKGSVIRYLTNSKSRLQHPVSSLRSHFNSLLLTQVCNSFITISANATCFSLFFLAFNTLDGLGLLSPNSILLLSASGAIMYSIILANASIICHLALILSGMEKCGGYFSFLKACILVRGRTVSALAIAVGVNLALAAVAALFQFRIVRAYRQANSLSPSMVIEGMFIAYMYSILVVLDTVIGCVFLRSCRASCRVNMEDESSYPLQTGRNNHAFSSPKSLEELP